MKIIIKFCEGKCTSCLQFILISLKINIRKFCQSKTLLITEARKPSFTSIRPVFIKGPSTYNAISLHRLIKLRKEDLKRWLSPLLKVVGRKKPPTHQTS